MAITCRLYHEGRLTEGRLDPSRVSEVIRLPGALVWLDVPPTQESMALLREEFGFHELALEDCLHAHQRAKIEGYDSYFFVIAYGLVRTGDELTEHEIAAFVGRNYLVTVRREPALDLAPAVARWEGHPELAAEGGGYLLYILLDEVVDRYFAVLDEYDDRIEDIEEEIVRPRAEPSAQPELFRIRKELVRFRRAVAPLRDVLDAIQRRGLGVVTPPLEPYFRDVYDHVLRVIDFIDTTRESLSTALESHLAVVSNRLNVIMRNLTSWAAIILVPTLIAGIYGMNFRHMPELDWRVGYPTALGMMLGSGFFLYRSFRKRDWL